MTTTNEGNAMPKHLLPDDYVNRDDIRALDLYGNLFNTSYPNQTIMRSANGRRPLNGLQYRWDDDFIGRHRKGM